MGTFLTMGNQQDREKISTTAAITGHEPVNRCYSDVREDRAFLLKLHAAPHHAQPAWGNGARGVVLMTPGIR
jgi:hypothetical protein